MNLLKATTITLLLLITALHLQAQTLLCGHSHTETDMNIFHKPGEGDSLMYTLSTEKLYFPVQIHIVSNSSGQKSADPTDIVKSIFGVNKNYSPANIEFYLSGPVDFITSDRFYNTSNLDLDTIDRLYNKPGVINIYYVKSINDYPYPYNPLNYSEVIGIATVDGSSGNPILLDGDFDYNPKVLTHEMGHFFSLNHLNINQNFMYPSIQVGICNFLDFQLQQISSNATTPQKSKMSASSLTVTPPTNLTASYINLTGIKLNWKDNAEYELGYIIERSLNQDFGYAVVDTVASSGIEYTDYSGSSKTKYYYRVRPGNSALYSNTASITTGIVYCRPANTFPCLNKLPDITIKSFAIHTDPVFTNTSNDCREYNYISELNSAFIPGTAYSFGFSMGTTASKKDSAYVEFMKTYNQTVDPFQIKYKLNLAIWIDLNKDGIFQKTEMVYTGSPARTSSLVNGTLTIPDTTSTGTTMMRIRAAWISEYYLLEWKRMLTMDPCQPHSEGEVEDYMITIGDLVTASANEKQEPTYSIYPNPSSGRFFISGETKSFDILDTRGNLLMQAFNTGASEINLSHLPDGFYFIRLTGADMQSHFEKLLLEKN